MIIVLMALVAAAGFSVSGIFARLASGHIAAITGSAVSVVSSLALAAIPALVLDLPDLARIPLAGFLWIILLAFVNYPLARTFNFAAIGRIGTARASPLFSSSPLWSLILAVAFLGERPNWVVITGTFAIVAGIIVIVTERQSSATRRGNQ